MTITCNAIIRNLDELRDFVDHVEARLKADVQRQAVPEFAVPLEIWMDETVGKLATHRWLHWDKADEDEANEGRDPNCSCRTETVDSASTEPPEVIRDEWCPVHGRDPDAELDRRRDDAMERDR